MSEVTVRREVVVEDQFRCDVCDHQKNTEERKIVGGIDICSSCIVCFPLEIIDALKTKEPRWKYDSAREIVYSIRDSDDGYSWQDGMSNLKEGSWAVFANGEAEVSVLEKLDDIGDLESRARDQEFCYRDFPRYLEAVLDNGKLRRYRTEWKLVEVTDGEEGDDELS